MKRIIRLLMLTVAMTMFFNTASAQKNDRQRMTREQLSEIQARRIAEKIPLDDATSNKFIEAYTACQKEIWALGPRNGKRNKDKTRGQMTDEETEKVLKERFEHSQKILDIRRKYYNEYSKFLTQKQIQRIYQLEKQMMNRLAGHYRNSPQGNRRR